MKSIMSEDCGDRCFICGRYCVRTEVHHIFGGANRKISDREGLTVHLCHECHTGDNGVHFDKSLMTYLHQRGQREFEKTHTREEFMQLFGKNFL